MSLDPVKNFAIVTVSTGYDNDDVSIVLTTGHGAKLPQPSSDGAFNLVWWNVTDYPNPADDPNVEIVRCTARSTDTLTVTRGQESTSGANHNTGGKTYKMAIAPTAKMITDIGSQVPTCVSTIPYPDFPALAGYDGLGTSGVNTTGYFHQFVLTRRITVNKISFLTGGTPVTHASTFKLAIYSEDGQTRLVSITSPSVAAANTLYSATVSAVTLEPGTYYFGLANTTANFDGSIIVWSDASNFGGGSIDSIFSVASENVLMGEATISAGTLPTTFTPASLSFNSAYEAMMFRLDN
jgi:hypothetical protein